MKFEARSWFDKLTTNGKVNTSSYRINNGITANKAHRYTVDVR